MKRFKQGFTLLELLLVMAVASVIIGMLVRYIQQQAIQNRQDVTVVQMRQILQAGMAYYVQNGEWPNLETTAGAAAAVTGGHLLQQSPAYLDSTITTSPWGAPYMTSAKSNSRPFTVYVLIGSSAQAVGMANYIAGQLPMGFTSQTMQTNPNYPDPTQPCVAGSPCYVATQVIVPPQVINKNSQMRFAGLYHHGGCVPVPTCSLDADGKATQPQVFIVPISVSGVNDTGSTAVYPISSFTGYASSISTLTQNPNACSASDTPAACGAGTDINTKQYWRACLQVITERGEVALTNKATDDTSWGQYATLAAFTRCAVSTEPTGSDFTVYTH